MLGYQYHTNGLMVEDQNVADMVKKEYRNLLQVIKGYEDILHTSLSSMDFFISRIYVIEGVQSWTLLTSLFQAPIQTFKTEKDFFILSLTKVRYARLEA